MTAATILGVILAGGASRRFGADKALALLGGEPLIAHVARRAAPQVGMLAVNVRPDAATLLDLPVIADSVSGQGPLAGVLAALAWAERHGFAHLATFPCDGPFIPSDLVARLSDCPEKADGVMACCGPQRHHTFALWHTVSRPRLEAAFNAGARSFKFLPDTLTLATVEFSPVDGIDPFFNINQPGDLAQAEALLGKL